MTDQEQQENQEVEEEKAPKQEQITRLPEDQIKEISEPDQQQKEPVDESEGGSGKRTIAIILGALVPIILAGLYLLNSTGLIDLSEHSELVELLQPTPQASENSIQVYFTTPQFPDTEADHKGGLDEVLAADMARARSSIDVAAYELDLETVADALLDAHDRDVKVRLVTDSDNAGESAVRKLKKAGIPVVEDNREPIMHNKYVVIDGNIVWTGSWNLTENGTYRNNNNAVRIVSDLLAENYTTEFEEKFVDGAFGPTSPFNTPHRQVTIAKPGADEGIRIETFFAPEDAVKDRIREMLKETEKSVRFMAFSFTHDRLGKDIKQLDKDGLVVQGVFEKRGSDTEFSEYGRMFRARPSMDVLRDANPYIMHHKVMILDDETVILGSYNFSENADEQNDENLLVIHDPGIAALYQEEFERIYTQAAQAGEE